MLSLYFIDKFLLVYWFNAKFQQSTKIENTLLAIIKYAPLIGLATTAHTLFCSVGFFTPTEVWVDLVSQYVAVYGWSPYTVTLLVAWIITFVGLILYEVLSKCRVVPLEASNITDLLIEKSYFEQLSILE